MTCKDCISFSRCKDMYETFGVFIDIEKSATCKAFKNKADFVKVVRCSNCKYSRPLNRTKSPEKYYKDSCVVCECEDVVGDEYMIYLGTHYCSYGERRMKNE